MFHFHSCIVNCRPILVDDVHTYRDDRHHTNFNHKSNCAQNFKGVVVGEVTQPANLIQGIDSHLSNS